MSIWNKIAFWGVNEKMPVYMHKSTVFFNIAMRISIIALTFVVLSMYFLLDMVYVPLGMIVCLPFIAFLLFLNYKGKVIISALMVALFFPLFFTGLSVFSKLNGEGLNIIYSTLPRVGIIIMSIIAYIVLCFNNRIMAFTGVLFSILVLIFFNKIHSTFGINIPDLEYRKDDFVILVVGLISLFFFTIVIMNLLQKINSEYEKIVIEQKNALSEKNAEILTQKEEIETQRDNLITKNELLEEQNREITDSIKYASRIQKAALPDYEKIKDLP